MIKLGSVHDCGSDGRGRKSEHLKQQAEPGRENKKLEEGRPRQREKEMLLIIISIVVLVFFSLKLT